ncbi:MAG TPA: response regulator transcription factor, partial [Bacteroidetes bacterium]|nr:response regulator transcription factor [Bacteroidota bacterium]
GGNGFEILKAVPQAKMPRFVFVTAHNKYAIEALRAGALDYLLKPVDQSALQVTCSKLLLEIQDATLNTFSLEELDASIPLTHQSGFLLVRLGDVVHLEADNNYTMIFLNEGHPQTSTQNLGKYEKILPPNWFFRVHRSHLINLHHLKAYTTREGGFVMMSDGAKLPVSRLRIPELLHQVSLLGMGKTNRK